LILDFELDQHLESHKHVISIIMGFRDTGCYTNASLSVDKIQGNTPTTVKHSSYKELE
jgi:hypothetical protein